MSDARPAEGVDPVTGTTYLPAPNREPAFVVPGRAEAAAAKMEAFRAAHRPAAEHRRHLDGRRRLG